MNRASHSRSRAAVTPARSGPIRSPLPIVWHAAQWLWNLYWPWSKFSSGASENGIGRDRVEEDVLAHAIAEQLLHLREPRGLERAGVLAGRVDQIDRDDLPFDQIVVEADDFAVLRRQLHVREVACAPAGVLRA